MKKDEFDANIRKMTETDIELHWDSAIADIRKSIDRCSAMAMHMKKLGYAKAADKWLNAIEAAVETYAKMMEKDDGKKDEGEKGSDRRTDSGIPAGVRGPGGRR